jgi:hypothetical protein
MDATLTVETRAEFEAFLAEQAARQAALGPQQ